MAQQKTANRNRFDFSKIPATIQIPNLIEVQKRGILEIGKAVRFIVGADDARPLRRPIANVQFVCRVATAGHQGGRDRETRLPIVYRLIAIVLRE